MTEAMASFGYWVRRRRKALDLTQEALARQVGCATVTVKKIEADERRPSRQIAERLAEVLAIPAEERALFLACARGQSTPLRLPPTTAPVEPAAPPPLNNLPAPLTVFIGREVEVKALAALLREPAVRLLTLTGPGGVGKTRLALAVARELLGEFRDGALFVDLAPVRAPEDVAAAIAAAAGLKDTAGRPAGSVLSDSLRSRQLLLVLDNYEHLLPAAPLASELLAAGAGLKVLATSRARLHLSGEHERSVAPLPATEAEALFVARAQAANGTFALNAETASSVAAICRRLDDLPLAIELAAAQCRLWPAPVVLGYLERRLPMLTGGPRDRPARQQTLWRTLDWSHALLDDDERRFFARLSVFAGGWTAEAAAPVAGDDGVDGTAQAAIDRLAALVDKSLVQCQDIAGAVRFSMLETVREYAHERLSTEADQVQQRHLAYFAELAQTLEDQVYRGWVEEAGFLQRLTVEHDNIRAALAWAFAGHDPERGAQLAAAMKMFWYMRGYLHEGRRWLEEALRQVGEPGETRAAALNGAGVLTWQQGDYLLAQTYLEEALTVWRRPGLEQSRGLAFALHVLGHVRFDQRAYAGARPLFAESLAVNRARGEDLEAMALTGDLGMVASQLGDYAAARVQFEIVLAQARAQGSRDSVALHLVRLGDLARLEGDYERAAPMYEESLALCREIGDVLDIAASLFKLGQVARRRGELARARALLREALELQRRQGNQQGIVECVAGLAGLTLDAGQPEVAARLFGAAEALLEALGAPLAPADQREWERDVGQLRNSLAPEVWRQAWAAGQASAGRGAEAVTTDTLRWAAD